jgi:hypothetical protein
MRFSLPYLRRSLVLRRAREPWARWAPQIEPGTSCTGASAIDLGGEPA